MCYVHSQWYDISCSTLYISTTSITGHGKLYIPHTFGFNIGTLYFLVMVYINRNMLDMCLDYWCVFDMVHVLV